MGDISRPLMRVAVDIYEGKLCYVMQHNEDQAVLFVVTRDLRTDYLATPPPPELSSYHAVFAALAALPPDILARDLADPRRALFLAPYVTMFATAQTTGDRERAYPPRRGILLYVARDKQPRNGAASAA